MDQDDRERDPTPDESATDDEAADFGGAHCRTDYEQAFTDPDGTFAIHRGRDEIGGQKDTFELLARGAASGDADLSTPPGRR